MARADEEPVAGATGTREHPAAVSASGLRTPALIRATDRLLDAAWSGVDAPNAAARAAVAEIADWCAVDLHRADGRLERAASALSGRVEPESLRESLVRFAVPEPALLERLAAARGPIRVEDPDWLPHHRAVAASIAAGGAPHGLVLALVPLGDRDVAEDLWFAGELGLRLAQVLELSGGVVPAPAKRVPIAAPRRPSLLLEPIASVGSGEIAAVEVAHAETLGPLAREEGCRVAAELEMRGLGIRVGVDVPADDLLQAGFTAELGRWAEAAGASPGRIILEVSGATVRAVGRRGLSELLALRGEGFLVAIDDYGTGSTLSADLLETSVDVLKLSPGLVAGAMHDAPRAERLAAVAELAGNLGLDLVAQGVATDSEMALVTELGCRWAQGEAIGRPRRLGELIERAGARV